MIDRRVACLYGCIALGLYALLSIPVASLVYTSSPIAWVVFCVLYELMVLGMALEATDLILALLLPRHHRPKQAQVDRSRVSVAVLYLCCDDVDTTALGSLAAFRDMDVFILDDSIRTNELEAARPAGVALIRRGTRAGFKAGNLNNWLSLYGRMYDYFLVLDSDSVMLPSAVWELVHYAEHPQNADVAVVQSMVFPRPGNHFQTSRSRGAGVRMDILERVHDRIGWTLSHGHNNLHRSRAILEVGGFPVEASCEDTLLSLHLDALGWRTILVDTISYESEPPDVFSFARRHVRWARQTVDVVATCRLRPHLGLLTLLTRHVLSYLLPAVCISLLAYSALATPRLSVEDAWSILTANYGLADGYVLSGLTSYLIAATFIGIVAMRLLLCLRRGVPMRCAIPSCALGGSLSAYCGLRAIAGMLRSSVGHRSGLTPTGSKMNASPSLTQIAASMGWSWTVYLGIAGALLMNAGLLLLGLNAIWATVLVSAPVVLWWFHRDCRSVGGTHEVR